jgi:hypothetical protein
MSASHLSAELRQLVIERAGSCCEYCGLHKDVSPYSHEIDHIVARKHGGKTIVENLALACMLCNRHKGSDLTAIDPISLTIAPIYNPRKLQWNDHFERQGARIVGLTPAGRATVFLLAINEPKRVAHRRSLIKVNRYP